MYTGQFFRMTVECSRTVSSFKIKSGGSLIGEVLDLSETVLSDGPLSFPLLELYTMPERIKTIWKTKMQTQKEDKKL